MRALICIFSVLLLGVPPASAQEAKTASRAPDVIYVPGSGDGRIAVTAAKKYGIRAVGIDIDPERIREANANARKAGVANLVKFRQEDLFEANFREATVVTLYLLPDLN